MKRYRARTGRKLHLLMGLVAMAAMVNAVSACGDPGAGGSTGDGPPSQPDITGLVWQVQGANDGTGSLLIVGLDGAPGDYDRASVRITSDTAWYDASGDTMSAAPLDRELAGRRVAATFTGAVAESYPVQATAASITLFDPLGVSMDVVPAGVPQLHGWVSDLVRDAAGKLTDVAVVNRAPDGGATSPAIAATFKLTDETAWFLATPTEFKSSPGIPLMGNGVTPEVEARVRHGVVVWIAVHLPEEQTAE